MVHMDTVKVVTEFAFDFPEHGERYEDTVWGDGSAEARVLDIGSGAVIWQRRVEWGSVDSAWAWGNGGMILRYGFR